MSEPLVPGCLNDEKLLFATVPLQGIAIVIHREVGTARSGLIMKDTTQSNRTKKGIMAFMAGTLTLALVLLVGCAFPIATEALKGVFLLPS